jgi:hypothetical protein
MKRLRFGMSRLLEQFAWMWACIGARFSYVRFRSGKLLILGPQPLITLCKSSLERLNKIDPDLHRHLTEHEKVCIFYDPELLHDTPDWRLFTVTERYVVWREDGIIARLVYINFKISVFPRYIIQKGAEGRAKQRSVVAQWKLWLENHKFPAELGN